MDNVHIESFHGRSRDECFESRCFESVDDAGEALQTWGRDYDEVRLHSSLGIHPQRHLRRKSRALAPGCFYGAERENAGLDPRRGRAHEHTCWMD